MILIRPLKRNLEPKNFITPKLVAALDCTKGKRKKRKVTFVIAETAQSLNHSIDDFINRTSTW